MSSHPCPERLLLPEALSGRLDPAEEKRVMAHLQTCPACQEAAADIEVALISLATLRVARDETLPDSLAAGSSAGPVATIAPVTMTPVTMTPVTMTPATMTTQQPAEVVELRQRHPVRRGLIAVAASIVLLTAGAAAGRELLPPRDSAHYGPPVALAPPPGAADAAARGSVKVATDGNALAVRLTATSLPAAGWYECVWNSEGQTRSAGSFRAKAGSVDVELRVAPPKTPGGWKLQVLAHNGTSSQVVLEGSAAVPS
jgi:anti-sigma factor RsiW